MSKFLLSFCALAFVVILAGCKQGTSSSSMDSTDMKGDKSMTPATMPATMPAGMNMK
jgi:hypothetical protein